MLSKAPSKRPQASVVRAPSRRSDWAKVPERLTVKEVVQNNEDQAVRHRHHWMFKAKNGSLTIFGSTSSYRGDSDKQATTKSTIRHDSDLPHLKAFTRISSPAIEAPSQLVGG